jgi:hypothetical protein
VKNTAQKYKKMSNTDSTNKIGGCNSYPSKAALLLVEVIAIKIEMEIFLR